jgi:hypothetical protein
MVVHVGLAVVLLVEVLMGVMSVAEGGVIVLVLVLGREMLEPARTHVVRHVVVPVAVFERPVVMLLEVIRHARVPTRVPGRSTELFGSAR